MVYVEVFKETNEAYDNIDILIVVGIFNLTAQSISPEFHISTLEDAFIKTSASLI